LIWVVEIAEGENEDEIRDGGLGVWQWNLGVIVKLKNEACVCVMYLCAHNNIYICPMFMFVYVNQKKIYTQILALISSFPPHTQPLALPSIF
jgi:hypothetical protein